MKGFIIQIAITISFIFTGSFSFAQIPKHIFNEVNGEEYNPKDFTSKPKPISERLGDYHFGESEGEWELLILANKDSLIIQIWNGKWGVNYLTKTQTWLSQCQTFNKVTVEGNKFYFGKYSGLFVEFKTGNKIKNSVLLFCDPISRKLYSKDSAEIGSHDSNYSIDDFYRNEGDKDYYKMSTAVQPESFFAKRSMQELKIMRNSIYAKYGLIFQAGGDMEKYFAKKKWYQPYLKDVSGCLTEIEKRNIETISRFEQM